MAELTVAAVGTTSAGPGELAGSLRLYERSLRAANRAETTIYKHLLAATQLIGFLTASGTPATAAGVHREHIVDVRSGAPRSPGPSRGGVPGAGPA